MKGIGFSKFIKQSSYITQFELKYRPSKEEFNSFIETTNPIDIIYFGKEDLSNFGFNKVIIKTYTGEINNKKIAIDSFTASIRQVEKLLNYHGNNIEQFLLGNCFEVDEKEVQIWFCGGFLYKIDFEDGCFYIGSRLRSVENYYGSGRDIVDHIHQNGLKPTHNNRTILRTDFSCQREMRNAELNELRNYFEYNNKTGYYDKIDDHCLNIEFQASVIKPVTCLECGRSNGKHSKECSKYVERTMKCEECGSTGTTHKIGCSKYREIEACEECGLKRLHKKGCPNSKKAREGHYSNRCEECGWFEGNHNESCSHDEKCKYCGGSIFYKHHTDDCPTIEKNLYKDNNNCIHCGYNKQSHWHKIGCPNHENNRFGKGVEKCDICGWYDGKHSIDCINDEKCEECGCSLYHEDHKQDCSHNMSNIYVDGLCIECGYPYQSRIHDPNCKFYKEVNKNICPDCKDKYGKHKKGCPNSKKEMEDICEECGWGFGKHGFGCSRDLTCPECGASIDKEYHKASCKYNTDNIYNEDGKCKICRYDYKSHFHEKKCKYHGDRFTNYRKPSFLQ